MTNEDAHDHAYEVIQDFVLALKAWKKDRKLYESGLVLDTRYANAAVLASVLALMNLAVESEVRAFLANDPTGTKSFNAVLSQILGGH